MTILPNLSNKTDHSAVTKRGGEGMEVTISGAAGEIAALVLAVQGRRKQEIKLEVDGHRVSEAVNHRLDLPDLTAP